MALHNVHATQNARSKGARYYLLHIYHPSVRRQRYRQLDSTTRRQYCCINRHRPSPEANRNPHRAHPSAFPSTHYQINKNTDRNIYRLRCSQWYLMRTEQGRARKPGPTRRFGTTTTLHPALPPRRRPQRPRRQQLPLKPNRLQSPLPKHLIVADLTRGRRGKWIEESSLTMQRGCGCMWLALSLAFAAVLVTSGIVIAVSSPSGRGGLDWCGEKRGRCTL